MGQLIERLALQRGYRIVGIADRTRSLTAEQLASTDVAIEFSLPSVAEQLCTETLVAGVPVVSGSTGWDPSEVKRQVQHKALPAFLHATNMSVGVNAMFAANRLIAQVLAKAALADAEYNVDVSIEETHHVHKLDAPSGTAVTLANDVIVQFPKYHGYALDGTTGQLPIESLRQGEVFGDHRLVYETPVDQLEISHSAKSRAGFATGALLAARYLAEQPRGRVISMADVLGLSTLP